MSFLLVLCATTAPFVAAEGYEGATDGRPSAAPTQVMLEFRIVLFDEGTSVPSAEALTDEELEAWGMAAGGMLNTFWLDMQVSSLEQAKRARLVSTPRVMVRLGETAYIEGAPARRPPTDSEMGADARPPKPSYVLQALPEATSNGVDTQWSMSFVEPEVHVAGTAVGDGHTGITLARLDDGRTLVVWVTNNLQRG